MLNYEITGKGKTMVFLHGFLENLKIWNHLVKDLKNDYRIITIDLSGHGKSKTNRHVNSMEDMAQDTIDVLNYLDIDTATFIGHSMGGYVVCAIADLYPGRVKNIVLMNSSTLPDDDKKKEQRLKAIETAQKNLKTLVSISIPNLFAAHHRENFKDEIKFIKEISLESSVDGISAALRGMRERPNRTYILYDFKGKIYIIAGENDETIDSDLFLTAIPNLSNIQVFKNKNGHMSFIENYNEVLNILRTI